MMALIRQFSRDVSGATAIEYALIAGLVSVVIVTALKGIGTKLNTRFTSVSNALN